MINWTNTRVKLGDLKPWAQNPRMSSKAQAKRLLESWKEYGQVQTIAISPTLEVYDGHQRLSALLTMHGRDYEIDARQSDRALTDDERRRLVVLLHAGAQGAWNWDLLSGWDESLLTGAGMDESFLKQLNTDAAAMSALLDSVKGGGEEDEQEKYSKLVKAPIYTPKGEKPPIASLYDPARTEQLMAEIEQAEIPEAEKQFLRVAANRHTVINFQRVAEYYAHSPAEVQRLFENSALVIIDFNRAIELGYVKLSTEVAEQYAKDYPDAR